MGDVLPREVIAKKAAEARTKAIKFESLLERDSEYAELSDKRRELSSEYLFGSSRSESEIAGELKAVEAKLNDIRKAHGKPDICGVCGGTGYADGNVCDCMLSDIYVRSFGAEDVSGFTESFEASDSEIFNGTDIITSGMTQRDLFEAVARHVSSYAEKVFEAEGKGLLIMGAPGLGKTFLCRCLARRAMQKRPVMYITAPELARDYLSHRLGEPVELKYVWQAPLLIVDDLGAETASNNVTSEYLCETIEKRAAKKLPTVFSTNLAIADIKKRYGERISSRLSSDLYSAYMLFGEDIRIRRK